jgi:hypothetical protein
VDRRLATAALEFEIAQEKASALGRLGRGLETTLSALRAFDAAHIQVAALSREDRRRRDRLVANAAQALWYLMVQRDACGLHGSTTAVIADYGVPAEVVNRAGPAQYQTAM